MSAENNEITQETIQNITEQYDTGFVREPKGILLGYASLVAVVMSAFHLYTAGFGLLLSMKQSAIHWMLVLMILFLYYPATKKSPRERPALLDVIWTIVGVASSTYVLCNLEAIILRGAIPNRLDMVMGVLMIATTLEATRRAVGKELFIICLVFLAYAFWGYMAPGIFGHKGFSLSRVVGHMYLTTEGIYGIPMGVSSTYLVLFIFFGALLKETGLDLFFRDVSLCVAGRITGGPAQVAVLASSLFGSINGSATANVVTTGAFTIPLMKGIGYPAYFAGAVEAVASTGGQLMPPIMGSAAFIMAEFLGIPYMEVAIAALIPALFYYFSCGTMVYMRAKKLGIRKLEKEELPDLRKTLRETGHMIVPIVLLIGLLASGKTPLYSAFYSILATVALSFLKAQTRLRMENVRNIVIGTAKSMITVAAACASAGIVVGVVSLTGIGLTLGNNLVKIAGDNVALMLVVTVVVSLIMGMGVPTTVVYILMATITAPPLVMMGYPPLAAHMFVFYFALLASVTPPVAIAAYAGAGLAQASPSKTGWQAFRLALAGFIVPFLFLNAPELLLQDFSPHALIPICTGIFGIVCLGAAVEGYFAGNLNVPQRFLFFVIAVMLVIPETITDLVGAGLFAVILFSLWMKKKKGVIDRNEKDN